MTFTEAVLVLEVDTSHEGRELKRTLRTAVTQAKRDPESTVRQAGLNDPTDQREVKGWLQRIERKVRQKMRALQIEFEPETKAFKSWWRWSAWPLIKGVSILVGTVGLLALVAVMFVTHLNTGGPLALYTLLMLILLAQGWAARR